MKAWESSETIFKALERWKTTKENLPDQSDKPVVSPFSDDKYKAKRKRELDEYESLHKEARELKQKFTTKIKNILETQALKITLLTPHTTYAILFIKLRASKTLLFLDCLFLMRAKKTWMQKTKMTILHSILQQTLVIAKQLMY